MATDSENKLTRYTSAVTVVTADVMNSLFGGEHGHNLSLDEFDPLVSGHVHDGVHADGHASKILLTEGSHVRGHLAHENLGGTNGTTPAVQAKNIQCYSDSVYGAHGGGNAIPAYTEDPDTGDRCYYLDLSMIVGGEDSHVQYNKDGEFAGDDGFVYKYEHGRVGININDPRAELHIHDNNLGDGGATVILTRDNLAIEPDDVLGWIGIRGNETSTDGIAAPGGGVSLVCSAEEAFTGAAAGSYFYISTTSIGEITRTEKMRVSADGNVGIGDSNPSSKLTVDGDGFFSGDGSFGGPLVAGKALSVHGDLKVTGLIDPIGLVLTETSEDKVLVKDNESAIFVSDGSAPLSKNKLYYKDESGNISEIGGNTPPGGPNGSIQFNENGVFKGDSNLSLTYSGQGHPALGIGLAGSAAARTLHVEDLTGAPPIRVRDLPKGSGSNVVWDPSSGDLLTRANTLIEPKILSWPQGGGDIIIDESHKSDLIIITGVWDRVSRVVVPNSLGTVDEWETGDNICIKNLSNSISSYTATSTSYATYTASSTAFVSSGGASASSPFSVNGYYPLYFNESDSNADVNGDGSSHSHVLNGVTYYMPNGLGGPGGGNQFHGDYGQSSSYPSGGGASISSPHTTGSNTTGSNIYSPIPIVSDTSIDTLDGESFAIPFILPAKNAIRMVCIRDQGKNSWILMSHYHEIHHSDNMPVAEIKAVDQSGNDLHDGDNIEAGGQITFNGNGSSDPDGDPISLYTWTLSLGGTVIGTRQGDSFSISTSEYGDSVLTVALVVTANGMDSTPSTFSLSFSQPNQSPVARISGDSTGIEGIPVTLSAKDSDDPDGTPITYQWSIISEPELSNLDVSSSIDSLVFTPSHQGLYTIGLRVSDGELTSNVAAHNVTISENSLPEITIYGSNPHYIVQGNTYSSAEDNAWGVDHGSAFGYSASDNEDGDITDRVAVTGLPVSSSEVGTASVKYTVTDDYGQTVEEVRSVIITQDVAPSINILGDVSIDVIEGSVYTDAGATAQDNEDGDITHLISVSGLPDMATPGTYSIEYYVSDSFGNSATETRTVTVLSNQPPTISLVGESSLIIGQNTEYTDAGATAQDSEDGILTNDIITNNPVDTSQVGTYEVQYSVSDSQGSTVSISRFVSVNASPYAIITGDSNKSVGDTVTMDGGSSYDDEGDPLTYSWSITNAPSGSSLSSTTFSSQSISFVPDEIGTYTVKLVVNDGYSNSPDAFRTLEVSAQNAPPLIENLTLYNTADSHFTTGLNHLGDLLEFTATITDNTNSLGSYQWSFASKPSASTVSGTTQVLTANTLEYVSFSFYPDVLGEYILRLSVLDDLGLESYEDLTIVVSERNDAPQLTPIETNQYSQTIAGATLNMTSTATDSDGSISSYIWSVDYAPSGSTVTLNPSGLMSGDYGSSRVVAGTFSADAFGQYTVKLTVTDDDGETAEVTKNIYVENNATITLSDVMVDDENSSIASSNSLDTKLYIGANITLGNLAGNPEARLNWEILKPQGSSAVMTPSSEILIHGSSTYDAYSDFTPDVPGVYTIKATVTDDFGSNAEATKVFSVSSDSPVVNLSYLSSDSVGIDTDESKYTSIPISVSYPGNNINVSSSIKMGNLISLSAAYSSDSEDTSGNPDYISLPTVLTYKWAMLEVPTGSQFEGILGVNNPPESEGLFIYEAFGSSFPRVQFRPDIPGVYAIGLVVLDSDGVGTEFVVRFNATA